MRKRNRIVATIIVSLVILTMTASTFVLILNSNTGTPTSSTADPSDSQIQSLQSSVDGLNQALKANPQDVNLQLNLANSYYDLAMAQYNSSSPDRATPNFKQAVTAYQEVIKSNKDVNVLVDMATAAFYGGDNTLAETTFKQALTEKPDFFNGLLNYGYFLMNAKGDYLGAIAEFNKALNTNPSPTDADKVKNLISMAQAKLVGNTNSKSSTTPAGK